MSTEENKTFFLRFIDTLACIIAEKKAYCVTWKA